MAKSSKPTRRPIAAKIDLGNVVTPFEPPTSIKGAVTNGKPRIDLKSTKIDDIDFTEKVGGKDRPSKLVVGKRTAVFFCVHEDPKFWWSTWALQDKKGFDIVYLVFTDPTVIALVRAEIGSEVKKMVFALAAEAKSKNRWDYFLLAINQGDEDSGPGSYAESLWDAAIQGRSRYVKITNDSSNRCYKITVANENYMRRPDWPAESMSEIVNTTFADMVIDSVDHPIVRFRGGKTAE